MWSSHNLVFLHLNESPAKNVKIRMSNKSPTQMKASNIFSASMSNEPEHEKACVISHTRERKNKRNFVAVTSLSRFVLFRPWVDLNNILHVARRLWKEFQWQDIYMLTLGRVYGINLAIITPCIKLVEFFISLTKKNGDFYAKCSDLGRFSFE